MTKLQPRHEQFYKQMTHNTVSASLTMKKIKQNDILQTET